MSADDSEVAILTEEQKEFLASCEAEFRYRFTDKDEGFVRFKDLAHTPPIIDPWYNKPKRNFSWSNRGEGSRGQNNWKERSRYNDRWQNHGGYNHREGQRYRPY